MLYVWIDSTHFLYIDSETHFYQTWYIELYLVSNFSKIPIRIPCISNFIYQTALVYFRIYQTFSPPTTLFLCHLATNFTVTEYKWFKKLLNCVTKK